RNLPLFLAVFVLIVGGVIFWTSRQTPSYSATASLLVQPRGEMVVDVQAVVPDVPATADVVDTRVALINSPAMAKRVALAYAEHHPASSPTNAVELDALAGELRGMVTVARSGATYLINITGSSLDPVKAAEVPNLFAEEFVASDKEAKIAANKN